MTSPYPALILDTCSIINLSYCAPVAGVFRSRYQGTALDHLGRRRALPSFSRPGPGGSSPMIMQPGPSPGGGGVRAVSTVGVIAHLLTIADSGVDLVMADTYLQTVRAQGRMHARLKAADLQSGDLGPWQ